MDFKKVKVLLIALKDCREAYLKSTSDEVAELFSIDLINEAIDMAGAPDEHRSSRPPVIDCKGCGCISHVDPDTGLCPDCAAWGEEMLADVAQRGRR